MAKGKSVRQTYRTNAFRVSYPELFEAKAQMGDTAKMRYTLNMLFPKPELVAQIQGTDHAAAKHLATDRMVGFHNALAKVARANFGPEVDLKLLKITQFRDGDLPKASGKIEDNEKGYIVIRTSSKDKPQCIDRGAHIITDPGELYPGCWARAVLTIAPFFKPQHGITIYLAGVQKLADDSTFSSRPRIEDEFDAIDDSDLAQDGGSQAVDPLAE